MYLNELGQTLKKGIDAFNQKWHNNFFGNAGIISI